MNTPLLLIHFNRPDCTRRQLEALQQIAPKRVWVLCDGARKECRGESERVQSVRLQLSHLPWKCQVIELYRVENLGVCQNIASGISWFLGQVEEGIILEDDCIPSPSFFTFSSEMLARYRSDRSVFTISGYTGKPSELEIDGSYCFSNYFACWGWATWKRAWDCYDSEMCGFCDSQEWKLIRHRMHPTLRQRLYWKIIFNRILDGKTDSWAYRMQLSIWKQQALSIFPKFNLVENTGFTNDATNTAGLNALQVRRAAIQFPLIHPELVKADGHVDRWFEDHIHSKSLLVRLKWIMNKLRLHLCIKSEQREQ